MSRPITWQQVAAPDFRAANQLVQQGSENITGAIEQVGDIGQKQSDRVVDRNVASLAQEIMTVGSGIEGLQNIASFENDLASIDADAIGGSQNLTKISSAIMGKRDQLESEAIGSFNDMLVQAEQTGDFDAVRAASSEFASLVRSSAPVLEEARSREATYNANMLQRGLASGEMTVQQVMSNPDVNLGQPEYANVLAMAALQTNNERMGGLMRQIPSFIESVTTGGKTPDDIRKELMSGFTDRELAENSENIFGIMAQVESAYSASLELTETERSTLNLKTQRLDGYIEQAEAEIENTAKRMADQAGVSYAAINALEMARDQNLGITEYISKTLGGDLSTSDRRNALNLIARNTNAETPIEAIAFAIDRHGKLDKRWFNNESQFKKLLKQGEEEVANTRNAFNTITAFKETEKNRLFDYKMNGVAINGNNQQTLINARRTGKTPQLQGVTPFESYDEVKMREMLDTLTKPSVNNDSEPDNKAPTVTPPSQRNTGSSLIEGFSTGRKGGTMDDFDLDNMTPAQKTAGFLGGVVGIPVGWFDSTIGRPVGSGIRDISEYLTSTPAERRKKAKATGKSQEQIEREEFAALLKERAKKANAR